MRYLLRRLALFVVALLVISLVVFLALRVLPGDIATIMAGLNASPERVAALRDQLGLDRPLSEQYGSWIAGLLHGDLGTTMLTGQSVAAVVATRARITFPLIILGLLVALAIGIPLGCAAVLARKARTRAFFQVLAVIGGAVPALWGGLLLILLFAKGSGILPILPATGFPRTGWHTPGQALLALVLPALTVGIIVGASIMRYTRSALQSVASTGTIEMAMACGMTRTDAVLRVGLRLAMPQLVSVVGLTFAEMVTGVMVIENLFALPGIGSGLVDDLGHRDLVAVQGELFLLAAFFLVIGLLVDLTHRALDPRLGANDD
ncbi:ABC transporter permease [Bifidobacterium cuniculi]|uniref:Peptide ABC transporter permease n=1 Tax=Bifidobacterium cuniculi TaxID=1688 RepID=A0A087AL24_9BIFI|nr:ABC transporter permease [Bifidobacterium cuniculi]KFI59474.1 peptide ABC transporter permease [Bifidobacterium cuniculi]